MGERTDMTRSAAVAGYFYSREADALRGEITALMREGAALRERQAPGLAGLFGQGTTLPGGARHPLMVLLPHAGYMYSGAVACAALAGVAKAEAERLPAGHGGVVEVNGEKLGLYKDGDGRSYAVRPVCPHLGCELAFNPEEKTWDCPCHGSRFTVRGELIEGPALRGLEG